MYRATCIGCEQTNRDTKRHVDPFIAKARWTIRHHAARRGMKSPEFAASFGWDVHRVAHLLRHQYENTCTYCRRPYSSMLNGVRDITIDIINPANKPYLETNTTPCCQTCNSSKRDLPPDDWARKLKFWREYEANQQAAPTVPVQRTLFDMGAL
jgi:5-methylcytosine-specific restriction endonuclease McrA